MPNVAQIPADLRARLEAARLDMSALFGALDRMNIRPAYADLQSWILDQPPGALNLNLMRGNTLAALEQLPKASSRFRQSLLRARPTLARLEVTVRQSMLPTQATIWFQAAIRKPAKQHPGNPMESGNPMELTRLTTWC
jgi:hypothetical protein